VVGGEGGDLIVRGIGIPERKGKAQQLCKIVKEKAEDPHRLEAGILYHRRRKLPIF